MTERCLFLDDVRQPYEGWDVVRSYVEFVDYIEKMGMPKVISFDHDLADIAIVFVPYGSYQEKTGYDCAKYLVDKGEFPRTVIVHSFNPVGARNIARLLLPYCPAVILDPYRATDVCPFQEVL